MASSHNNGKRKAGFDNTAGFDKINLAPQKKSVSKNVPKQQRNPTPSAKNRNTSSARITRAQRRRAMLIRLGFVLFVIFIIVLVVIFVRGCDTGEIKIDTSTNSGIYSGTGQVVPTVPESTLATMQTSPGPTTATIATTPTSSVIPTGPTTAEIVYYDRVTLGAGNYEIGKDLSSGSVDLIASSGTGSISTTNGTVSIAAFGNADSSYVKSAGNVALTQGSTVSITGSLNVEFCYLTKPNALPGQMTGGKVYTFKPGKYIAGEDFETGKYKIEAVSGFGTVVSSNARSGSGVDEMIGENDSGGNYVKSVSGVVLPEGVEIEVTGCTVRLTKTN